MTTAVDFFCRLQMYREVGFTELLFTSENGMGLRNGHIPGGQSSSVTL